MPAPEFDIFLSYSRKDEDFVRGVAEALREQQLRAWFDRWEMRPGLEFQDQLDAGIRKSASVAVFIGPSGLGDWERSEMRVALNRLVKERAPVIPVVLPNGSMDTETWPAFLAQVAAVDFRAGLGDQQALQRLIFGITGKNPLALPAQSASAAAGADPPAGRSDPIDSAIEALVQPLLAGEVTFFLGRVADSTPDQRQGTPCELSSRLLGNYGFTDQSYRGFVPEIEAVASLVAATKTESELERRLMELLEAEPESRSRVPDTLAQLMKVLGTRPWRRRARPRPPRIILTTNFNVRMERALLRAGVSFSRLVQHRSEQRIDINDYRDVARTDDGRIMLGGNSIAADDTEELDQHIAAHGSRSIRPKPNDTSNPLADLPIGELGQTILYKFHGSQDIRNSCAISADQCFDFAWRLLKQECVPTQLCDLIGNSALLVCGASVLNYDFRVTYHTLLRKPLEISGYSRYAVMSREDADQRDCTSYVTKREWGAIKDSTLSNYRINTIDARVGDFLRRLLERVECEPLV